MMIGSPADRADGLDRARALVAERGGRELLERIEHLDAARLGAARARPAGRGTAEGERLRELDATARRECDVVIVGGGLSLLIAPLLAERGMRVAVVERGTAGIVHRGWNVSRAELEPLHRCGLFSRREVDELIVARYRCGICSWYGGGSYPVRGVLDCAVDAPRFLWETRLRAEARGVTIFDGHELVAHRAGRHGVRLLIEARADRARTELTTRILVDARGAASPYAEADLVCPTVGGVLEGLAVGDGADEIDPAVGEILVTTEDALPDRCANGRAVHRQHIWEGFPGEAGETTVYLFYYAPRDRVGPDGLLGLLARFFAELWRYKRGEPTLVRPTFGYIPGWSRLTPAPQPAEPRVVLVGDAAARHSPLTFCGFGSMIRSFRSAARAIAGQAERDDRSGATLRPVVDDAPIHGATGALARMMATPLPGHALNALLDIAFATLAEMGDGAYAALLRDEMSPGQFVRFLRRTSARRPRVYLDVLRMLGPAAVWSWGRSLGRGLRRGRR